MLGLNELRKAAQRSGARDIGNIEIDVILTHLLQLFDEKKITTHAAFKGGTMLRKMVFGPRGRLSTDLDFTCRTDISNDDLMMEVLGVLGEPYRGLRFKIADKDWYQTDEGCAVNPVCSHEHNEKGVNIKLQFSMRERPILPVVAVAQIKQDYFENLGFDPAAIPSLAFEEAVAEKIRAASQRSKIRDLHDLSEIAARDLNRGLIRSLAVLKLWNSGGPGLDYARFAERVKGAGDYDIADLANLLRNDQKPDLEAMMKRVVEGFRFLNDLSEAEKALAADTERKKQQEADALIETLAPAAERRDKAKRERLRDSAAQARCVPMTPSKRRRYPPRSARSLLRRIFPASSRAASPRSRSRAAACSSPGARADARPAPPAQAARPRWPARSAHVRAGPGHRP